MVVAQGTSDMTRDSFGRNDWNFVIDFENFYVQKNLLHNNILCYDEQGIMCWQISNKLPSNIVSKEQIPYIAIQVIDGKLYATDFWGRKFNVDTENGELIDVKIVH